MRAASRVAFVLAFWPFIRAAYWITGSELRTSLREGLRYAVRPEVS